MPGFGSIFPTNRTRCTVLHPPSKLSKFTHFTASEGGYSRGRGRELDVRSKSGIPPSSSGYG
eukprot:scaffold48162_cov33-Phaeocystis_antarctica.AAC.1